MAKHFLFLELLDPEINSFLLELSEVASGYKSKSSPHLTVRGPYDSNVPPKILAFSIERMKYNVLKISNVGRFSNDNEEVVYFLVDSTNLREIWYKPTFTIEEYGFNPHLSIYRGNDKDWADILYNFLKLENIELLCAEFQLVPHVTKQTLLIKDELKTAKHYSRLIESNRISETLIGRLKRLKSGYESKKNGDSPFFQLPLI